MRISKKIKDSFKLHSKVLALSVRNELEDLHSDGTLPQGKMKEINTIIRDSIYSTLLLSYKAKNGDKESEKILKFLFSSIPDYWEEPKEIKR